MGQIRSSQIGALFSAKQSAVEVDGVGDVTGLVVCFRRECRVLPLILAGASAGRWRRP